MAIGEGDIMLDENNTIRFENGDLKLGDAPEQHLGGIINAAKGNWRRYPTLGVDIQTKIDSPQDIRSLEQEIRLELEKDGYVLSGVDVITEDNEIVEINISEAEKVTDETESLI